ncbi:MAG: hypothetical protein LBD11_01540 [Candidatus Peribacteria bacterium]|jgi:hypothetical protein|nr:hypothetical protein [Candidatus Peribacteria bacterium]
MAYGKKTGVWKFWGWVILVLSIYIAGGLTLPPMIKSAKGWAIEKLSDTPKEESPKKEEPTVKEAPSPKEKEKTKPVEDETVKDEQKKEEASTEEAPESAL